MSNVLLRRQIILPILILLIIAGAYNLASIQSWVQAQVAGQGLEISPPTQELTVDPGETRNITATIRNRSNSSLPIKVRIEDFTASGEEGQIAITQAGDYSVTTWTALSPTSFTLSPNAEREVTATITVPKDAAGGRYGSFVFGVKPETPTGGAAALSQQIASLFLLRISGPVSENVLLDSFDAPMYSEFGPIPLSLRFTNSGNVHSKVYGVITVYDVLGRKIDDVVVQGTNVFPNARRLITVHLPQRLLLGPMHGVAVIYYGATSQDTLTAEETFFVFPTRIAVVVFVAFILLFLLRKRLAKAGRALFG